MRSADRRAARARPRRTAGLRRALSCFDFAPPPGPVPLPAGLAGSSARRRLAAERLLQELLSLPEEERRHRLSEKRFHDPLLFELLVAAGHDALPADPRAACEVVDLADGLVCALEQTGVWGPEIGGEGYCRALCLSGTARRLLGEWEHAEADLVRASYLPVSAQGRASCCRALAVLRWDQGRSEEAAALLHQAQRRYAEGQDEREEAACLALLGLLHVENVEPWRAARFLREASQGLDADRRPWLAAHCLLGLAFCDAFADQPERARSARQQAQLLFSRLTGEEELLARWLEGRVAALAGDAEEAGERLVAVWRSLLGQRRLAEATFATIDLALLWSGTGRGAEVGVLVEELKVGFAGEPGLAAALGALRPMAEDASAGRLDRELWSGLSQPLRMAFRWQGIPFRPLPFI